MEGRTEWPVVGSQFSVRNQIPFVNGIAACHSGLSPSPIVFINSRTHSAVFSVHLCKGGHSLSFPPTPQQGHAWGFAPGILLQPRLVFLRVEC